MTLPMNGNKAAGIFALLTGNPGVLNASSKRAPEGYYIVEIVSTREAPSNARSGAAFIIEYRILSGPLRGQTFSSVPKLQSAAEAATRELVAFVAAAEGKSLEAFTDPRTGLPDGHTLSTLIARAFQAKGADGQPTNPYKGFRTFLRTEARMSEANRPYVRHEWSACSESLARQAGMEWPAALETAPAVPGAPVAQWERSDSHGTVSVSVHVPAAPPAPFPSPAPAPMAPAAPMAPPAPFYPAPAAPMAPPAPLPPPPAAPLTTAALYTPPAAPAPAAPAAWVHSSKFPGWSVNPADDAPGATYYNPATGETVKMG